jgi:hypothetical protein
MARILNRIGAQLWGKESTMRRIVHLAALAALACGAQLVSAQQTDDGTALNLAQAAAPAQRYQTGREAQPMSSSRNVLIELGFATSDGFPQRGALVDD